MTLFLAIVSFWTAVLWAAKFARSRWTQYRLLQPVRYVSEIRNAAYYAQIPAPQFERLIMKSLKERGFVILDDPYLGRSKSQGYAWKKGKKYVVVQRTDGSLPPEHLADISKAARRARADQALVFWPSREAPKLPHREIQLLAGKSLISWFAVLDGLRPPTPQHAPAESCACGSPSQPRINSQGNLLITCSRFPLCRTTRLVEAAPNQLPAGIQPALA